MTLLLAALSGDALANGLGDSLSALMNAHGSSSVAVACAPLGALVGELSLLPPGVTEEMPPGIAALFSREAALAAGLDMGGTLALGGLPETQSGWLQLPFAGDPAAAETLMSGMNLSPFAVDEGRWELKSGMAEAWLNRGLLSVRLGEGAEFAGSEPGIFDGLPEDPACLLWLDVPEPMASAKGLGDVQGIAWMPLARGEEALLRVKIDAPAPDVLAVSAAGPVGGSSSEAPTIVASVGVSLGALLEDPLIAKAMEIDEREARKAARFFSVGPGVTVAVFGDPRPNDLSWVAVLPVEHPARPAAIARRARKAMRKLEMEIDRGTRTAFVARKGDTTLYAAAGDGRIVLGRDPMRVTEAASGAGRSWLEGANLDRIQRWPVALWTGPGLAAFEDVPEGLSLDLGLRTHDGFWEVGVRMEGGPSVLEAIFERSQGDVPGIPGFD